jgi:hypothetical protein
MVKCYGIIPLAPVPPNPLKFPPKVGIFGLPGFFEGFNGLRALSGLGGAFFFIQAAGICTQAVARC